MALPKFPLSPQHWPGDLDASRPGQFWRLTCGHDEWAWGGIYQIISVHPGRDELTAQRWTNSTCAGYTWSVYSDASWRAWPPNPPRHKRTQGTHEGRGALFLTADTTDWCAHIAAQVADLLVIHAGLILLHSLNLRGTVDSDCLAAVKKITRRWTPGSAFQDTSAALVAAPGPPKLLF